MDMDIGWLLERKSVYFLPCPVAERPLPKFVSPFLLTAFLLNKKRVHLTLTLGVDFSVVGFGPGPTIHASPGAWLAGSEPPRRLQVKKMPIFPPYEFFSKI